MKIDLELISAALNAVLKKNGVAPLGAIPLRALVEHWEATHLRGTDLGAGIEALHRDGEIELEPRRDGLWVRRRSQQERMPGGAYERLRVAVRELVVGLTLEQVQRRRNDGYSGIDRRHGQRRAAAPGVAKNGQRRG